MSSALVIVLVMQSMRGNKKQVRKMVSLNMKLVVLFQHHNQENISLLL